MDKNKECIFSDEVIKSLRVEMLKFAKLQLRDKDSAEDVVQEALSSAYLSKNKFSGHSQLKTWVFSILKNKIVDTIRANIKNPILQSDEEEQLDKEINSLFNEKEHWHKNAMPCNWSSPDNALKNKQFWVVFEICLNNMPTNTAKVFSMREFLGLKTEEICKSLKISESNCWVTLHRARSILRMCLEARWTNA